MVRPLDFDEGDNNDDNEYDYDDDDDKKHIFLTFMFDHTTTNAQCVKPLRNWEFKDWPKMMTLAPIFLKLIYFRPKYLDACSSSVSLSIYIWVQVENRQIQQ